MDATSVRTWCMLIHLSMYAGFVVPLAGVVVPVALWLLKRSESRDIDEHGRAVVNLNVSLLVYALLALPLCCFGVGIPLLFAIAVCALVYPLVGAIRAHGGETFDYPGALRIL
ncbi:MAG: DUF4870 domain-containing protein [Planctomycetota bacterium]